MKFEVGIKKKCWKKPKIHFLNIKATLSEVGGVDDGVGGNGS